MKRLNGVRHSRRPFLAGDTDHCPTEAVIAGRSAHLTLVTSRRPGAWCVANRQLRTRSWLKLSSFVVLDQRLGTLTLLVPRPQPRHTSR